MTGIALDRGVRSEKREPVLMRLDLLDRSHPSLHRVARFAVGAELPFMNVGVTIGALGPNV